MILIMSCQLHHFNAKTVTINYKHIQIFRKYPKILQFKREAEANIVKENGQIIIKEFYPMNLLQKLSIQKESVTDWRQMVESIFIDWNYDGNIMHPAVCEIPEKKDLVKGIYEIPDNASRIKIKITDLLSESLEVEV